MFEVVTAASDRNLLTLAELRAAVGDDDGSEDAASRTLGNYVSATIVAACRVATDGEIPATLRLEIVRDTYRSSGASSRRHTHRGGLDQHLLLSRKPIISITSVVENDVTLASTDFLVNRSAGLLTRLWSDREGCWPCGKIVVDYPAGWATVPDTLKFAATKFIQLISQQAGRDPLLRRKVVPGVSEKEWWVEPSREVGTPPEVYDLLNSGGFVNEWVG